MNVDQINTGTGTVNSTSAQARAASPEDGQQVTRTAPTAVVNGPSPPVPSRPVPPRCPLFKDLLSLVRADCADKGIPGAVALWLPRAAQLPPDKRAVLLQRLALALPDDCTPASPQHPRPGAAFNNHVAQAEAEAVHRGYPHLPPPSHFAHYRDALARIEAAMEGCGHILPGKYGFIRQSRASRQQLAGQTDAQHTRTVLSGWIKWQWAALPARSNDPLMMDPSGPDRWRPLRLAYALDAPTRDAESIRAALSHEVALGPPADNDLN